MFYTFHCAHCNETIDRWQNIADEHVGGECRKCGQMTVRVYNAQIAGDEFKSGTHFNPSTRRMERCHGDHFDIGLGKWVSSKSERARLMKERELHEHPYAGLKEAPGCMGDHKGVTNAGT
jgi:predicted nucleic acid-binding Zn ribbon protein